MSSGIEKVSSVFCGEHATLPSLHVEDLGNNETRIRGVSELHGRFTAHTGAQSKTFKTFAGAAKWLARRGLSANGEWL